MKLMLKTFLVAMLLSVGYGCSILPKTTQVIVDPGSNLTKSPITETELKKEKTTVVIDPYLLEVCHPLLLLPENLPITPDYLLDIRQKELVLHKQCIDKHSGLTEIIKKAFNIEQVKQQKID